MIEWNQDGVNKFPIVSYPIEACPVYIDEDDECIFVVCGDGPLHGLDQTIMSKTAFNYDEYTIEDVQEIADMIIKKEIAVRINGLSKALIVMDES